MKKILYFVPHQDDELLGYGLDIAMETKTGSENVYVYLCTDGSSSGVRRMLCDNNEACFIHQGKHQYDLSREEFSKARDREFVLSLVALGVKKENIKIYEDRAVDGSLTFDYALKKMREEIKFSGSPDEISIRAYAPYRKKPQQTDHSRLGLAAIELFENNEVGEIKLIVENPELDFSVTDFPQHYFSKISFDDDAKVKITNACKAYRIWEPENGFYAIGYHSVYGEFVNYLTFPDMYAVIKSK